MKKLKEELFINAEEVYGKEVIDKLSEVDVDLISNPGRCPR